MTGSRLKVDLAGLDLANPTMLASGILGYTKATLESVEQGGVGAVVTKSVGAKPREGYANPTVYQADYGLINAMGLPNPGIDAFAKEIREAKKTLHVPLIVSVLGYSAKEYAAVASKAAEAGADAVELNVSCPHVKETGSEIGQNPAALAEVVHATRKATSKPLFVKLSPNVTCITDVAETAEKAGADALTATNTMKAMAIDPEIGMPVLSNQFGGLSGPALKPIALKCVFDIYERTKLPLIGCGGIASWQDAVEFILAGAAAVQIGTALASRGPTVFRSVTRGLENYLRRKGFESVKEIVGLSHGK